MIIYFHSNGTQEELEATLSKFEEAKDKIKA
jgi:hypothetical protein